MEVKYNVVELIFARAERPKFTEKGKGGMVNFGEYNNYPSFLNELYDESPKHGAIIKGKRTYIFGKGLSEADNLRPANSLGETWNDILRKCILDDEKFGGYYLQIVWSKTGQIASVYHLKFHKVRTNQDNSLFWVKDEWDANKQFTTKDRAKEREYKAFDVSNRTGTQIFMYKQDGDQNDVYPLPSYYQALNYIDSDRLLSQHILGMAKDGFVASKLINFNNGVPSNEEKEKIEKAIAKKFTGADGKRFMLSFNNNTESAVSITDLGSTMLTKEDFTNINNLIQQEIFAAHQITSPILFGIKTEGQLGGRNEMRDAYEIFNNTYVTARQQVHEENFNGLIMLSGQAAGRKIMPVEPLGFEITTDMITAIGLPKKYFIDKLGINVDDYPELQTAVQPVTTPGTNDSLTNLTGRQMQNIMRVVRHYGQGKITRPMAVTMLQSGYGLNEAEILNFLGEDEQQFSAEGTDALVAQFRSVGEPKQSFVKVKAFSLDSEVMAFAKVEELGTLEADIVNLISKDERITPDVIAEVTGQDMAVVKQVISELEKSGYIKTKGEITSIIKKPPVKPTTTQILVRYSYEGPKDDRNRDFCAKMLELDRYYSRADIEKISQRMGYSVWDSRGGWLTLPDGSHQPFCRHRWETHIVLRKS